MTTYVMRNGRLVEKNLAGPLHVPTTAPGIISDTMDPTRHMATGRYFTSKAAFRAETKAAGCVEVGNDPSIYKPRKPIPMSREQRREDIRRVIYNLRNGIKD